MECLRKAGEKSENGMSVIVEVGALAIVTNVSPLSPTSKYDIPSLNNEEPECFLAVPKMQSPVRTNIQHKLNRSLVLMILLATSGFVVWNGVKWTAKIRKEYLYDSFILGLKKQKWYREFNGTYIKKMEKYHSHESSGLARLHAWIEWMLDSFKNKRKNAEKVKSSFPPYFFVWSLGIIDEVVTLVKVEEKALTDEKALTHDNDYVEAIIEAINEYMQEFLDEFPNFLSVCPALKPRYKSLGQKLSNKYHQLSAFWKEGTGTISDT